MSRWEHARIQKKVINLDHDGTRKVMCAWDFCENDGYDLHQVRIQYGTPAYPQVVKHVFCCERHKQYWLNNIRNYGNLPPGFRRSII